MISERPASLSSRLALPVRERALQARVGDPATLPLVQQLVRVSPLALETGAKSVRFIQHR